MGQTFIKTEPREGAEGLSVEAPCRFLVLPDFFADDIVIDAAEIPMASAEIPSENFLLHLLPDRQAIVMAVADNRGQDARINLSGEEGGRLVRSSRMSYGKGGKIWVAVLQAPGVWHQRDVTKEDAGKVLALDWTAPFSAQWRVDWRLRGRLTASWEMAAQMKSGEFLKYGWFGSPRHAARRSQTLDHGVGQFSLSLLAGPGPPRTSPAVDANRTVSRVRP